MKLNIEKRSISGGRSSLRLIYYYGSTKDESGKITHHREREKLDLFLYDKPKTSIEKQHNKEAMQLAEAIKAKRMVEHQSGKHGFKSKAKKEACFLRYLDSVQKDKDKNTSPSNAMSWHCAIIQFKKFYDKPSLPVDQLNTKLVEDFADYLKTAKQKNDKPLSSNTQETYFKKIATCMNALHKEGLLDNNITEKASTGLKRTEGKRVYLVLDEVKALAKTECKYDELKRMFLFSCLTGLRWSDIRKLSWADIHIESGQHRIIFNQQKTGGLQYLDIPDQAVKLLGEKKDNKTIFTLNYSDYMNSQLLRWCLKAGITKDVSFHSGRHTFAVVQLMQGTPIFTVSKLMGHKTISTTMVYAHIVDQERKNAMNAIPDIEL